jgi:hypothetical protein
VCCALSAQPVLFGVKGGATVTEPAERFDESRHYAIGPYLEVRLPAHFAIEGDAIYTRFGSSSPLLATATGTRTRGDLWQFPILGKYHIVRARHAGLEPFISAGFAARKIWLTDNTDSNRFFTRSGRVSDWGGGAAFGGGLDFRVHGFGIAPEFRYIRWESRNVAATNPGEAQILIGIHF